MKNNKLNKKHIISLLLVVGGLNNLFGQMEVPDINLDVPNIISPSPTVASLMKFEEIPVNKYTGMPDISVPFFNTKMANGGDFNVNLSYHAANIDLIDRNVVASDVGLGWSLMAGGTISRTVRGMPDEILEIGKKIGVYHTSIQNNINRFYEFNGFVENNAISSASNEMVNEYLWDVNVKGKYDTEHDLYQYNFLGQTGRFIIKKVDNQLQVFKLDENNLKIINTYNGTTYKPDSFTIIDDFGNRYVFDVIENTHSSQLSSNTPAVGTNHAVSLGLDYEFRSAFHLSKVYDHNSVLLLDLHYNENEIIEIAMNHSQAENYEKNNSLNNLYQSFTLNYSATSFNPLPRTSNFTHQNTTLTKKLSEIHVPGKAKLFFVYTMGRSDYNMHNPSNAYKLSEVSIDDWSGNANKKINLIYTSSNHNRSRLLLAEIKQFDNDFAQSTSHHFSYKEEPIIEDVYNHAQNKINLSTLDVLEKMTYPTGGSVEFSFESNTYSHIGNEPILDFDANPENWLFHTTRPIVFTTSSNDATNFFEIFEEQSVPISATINVMNSGLNDWYLTVKNVTTNQIVGGLNGFSCLESTCNTLLLNLPPALYTVTFTTPQNIPPATSYSVSIKAHYKVRRAEMGGFQPRKFIHGGGIRIKEINYFEDAETSNAIAPVKSKFFNYNFFDDQTKSSGSLVYPAPVFSYEKTKKECVTFGNLLPISEFDLTYDVTTSNNNLSFIKTKGSDVGYKNVTVYETDNGRIEYTYTSAIEYPETIGHNNIHYPYLPSVNIDHKRGLLLQEKVFDNDNRLLKKTNNQYSFEDYTLNSGLRFYNIDNYQFINYKGIADYGAYIHHINTCSPCFCYFGIPSDFIFYHLITEGFGLAQLNSSEIIEYFYYNQNSSEIKNLHTYTYNIQNQKLSEHLHETYTNDTYLSKFYYSKDSNMANIPFRTDLINRNIISEPLKIESFFNSEKVLEKSKEYKKDATSMQLLLPKQVMSKKGNDNVLIPLESKVLYNKYDSSSNILELQQENGTKISYIWGYHKTQPVAKLENMAYDDIPANLITAIQNETNSLTATETTILNALNALRTSTNANLQNAMITTYTYKPLVGIKTVTDPKGYTMTYHYDVFNRLEKVTDMQNNILSENQYHYRTQN